MLQNEPPVLNYVPESGMERVVLMSQLSVILRAFLLGALVAIGSMAFALWFLRGGMYMLVQS